MSDFKPMLAAKANPAKLKFPAFVQPKLDGIRCSIVNGRAVTRTLKEIPNREIFNFLSDQCFEGFEGFDGEIIVGNPTDSDCYRKTSSFTMSPDKTGAAWAFWVFDVWNTIASFEARYRALGNFLAAARGAALTGSRIRFVPTKLVGSAAQLQLFEGEMVDQGHEGVIVRDPKALYKFGRAGVTAGELLKVKRFTDSEAVVVGVYEEMHNANEATTNALGRTERSSHQANKVGKGTLGGLIVELLHDHAGFPAGTEFRVGTGFDAKMRRELWAAAKRDEDVARFNGPSEHDEVYGRIVRFKHFECGAKDKPRHPVFLGWRSLIDIGSPDD